MNKLMIVDDEYLSRYSLRTLISKKLGNIEIVAEAENGRQAIELNRKLRPDIIVMDIKMPGINGIDASVEIISEFPDTSILILTAYDNFDYIKRALDIGVKGYILKPVKEAEVIEKINKVLSQINERVNHNDFMEMVESKIKIVKPFMEDELVSAFIKGSCDAGKIDNYIAFLEEEVKAGYFMLISPGNGLSNEINDCIRNRIIKEKMLNILNRHLPLMKKCLFGKTLGNSAVVFITAEIGHSVADVMKEALMIAKEAKRKLKIIGDIDAAVGIGCVHNDVSNFSKSYNEAAIALKSAVVDRDIRHFGLLDTAATMGNTFEYPLELENKFIEQLKTGNFVNAKSIADELLTNILENSIELEAVKEFTGEFLTVLKRTVSKMGINLNNSIGTGMLSELSSLSSAEEVEIWFRRNLSILLEQVEKGSKNTDVISKVFDYLSRNFNKDITLELVASESGITPQYLSKLFKDKYGTNFIDYITKKRLEYATELLRKGNANIKDISRLAGYEDANYFCRVFKKETGLSPKDYRAIARRSDQQ